MFLLCSFSPGSISFYVCLGNWGTYEGHMFLPFIGTVLMVWKGDIICPFYFSQKGQRSLSPFVRGIHVFYGRKL